MGKKSSPKSAKSTKGTKKSPNATKLVKNDFSVQILNA